MCNNCTFTALFYAVTQKVLVKLVKENYENMYKCLVKNN